MSVTFAYFRSVAPSLRAIFHNALVESFDLFTSKMLLRLMDTFRGCVAAPVSGLFSGPSPSNDPTSVATSASTNHQPPATPMSQPSYVKQATTSSPPMSYSPSSSPTTTDSSGMKCAVVPNTPARQDRQPLQLLFQTWRSLVARIMMAIVSFFSLAVAWILSGWATMPLHSPSVSANSQPAAPATAIASNRHDVASKELSVSANNINDQRLDSTKTPAIPISPREKAEQFVNALVDLHGSVLLEETESPLDLLWVTSMATDNMVDHVERLLVRQEALKVLGVCHTVDLGYHFTEPGNLETIRQHGLLTRKECASKGISGKKCGVTYNDGIYTCNNHKTHRKSTFGPTGLLVMRLQGMTTPDHKLVPAATYVNQSMVVLRCAAQCVVVLAFDESTSDAFIVDYHVKVQKLMDLHFNDGVMSLVEKDIYYEAPPALDDEVTGLVGPMQLSSDDDCPICLCPLKEQPTALITYCGHQFHFACIETALSLSGRCPLCKKHICEPRGRMPSGTMHIRQAQFLTCKPYPPGSITIQYVIDDFIQKEYHWYVSRTTRISLRAMCLNEISIRFP